MNIRKPKTYESITAGLRTMLNELSAFAETKTADAQGHRYAADQHMQDAAAADDEAAKAQFTAEKIAGLLS